MRCVAAVIALVAAASPAGLIVRPDVADRSCNGGRGITLSGKQLAGDPVVSVGALVGGSTLVAVTDLYPGKPSATIETVSATCRSVRTTQIAAPRRGTLWIQDVSARRGGGALVAGRLGSRWIVAALNARGVLDPRFGDRGWTLLPFKGEVTAILEEPSGRIALGGDNGGGGCCNRTWAAALSPTGQLDRTFGTNGRTELPTGEDSGVSSLAVEPNGTFIATVVYGNMGCWGTAVAALTHDGRPVPGFAERFGRFYARLGFHALIGATYVSGSGFTFTATGQHPCAATPGTASAPSATGVVARFRSDGTQLGRTIQFHSRMRGSVWAFPRGSGTLVVDAPYGDFTHLTATVIRRDGSSTRTVAIRTPWRGLSSGFVVGAAPNAIVVAASRDGTPQIQLVRLRI